MAIDTLKNGLSKGAFTAGLNEPTTSPNMYKPPARTNKVDASMAAGAQVFRNQFPQDLPKYYFNMKINKYSRQNLMSLGTLAQVGNVVLPLPVNISDSQAVSYTEENIGQALGLGIGLAKDATSMIMGGKDVPGQMKNMADAGKTLVDGMAGVGVAVGGQVLENLTGQNATGAISALTGWSPNQFLTILLKGPQYKRYMFQWMLAAKNEQESVEINNIIRTLNNAMAPGLGLGGSIFTFPRVFENSFWPNSKYLYKFKPSVLTDFSVNYSAGGQPSFFRADTKTDGLPAPESVQIGMQFTELEFWIRGDFNDNNDPYDTKSQRDMSDFNMLTDTIKRVTGPSPNTTTNEPLIADPNGNPVGGGGR